MKKAILLLGILFLAGAGHVLAGKNQAETERYAFVTNEGDNNLIVVDLNTEKTVRVLPTGKAPHALAFTNKGKGYVNNRGSKDLTVIDGNRFEVITTIPLSATSFQLALSPDGKTLAVAYKDALKVSLIDTSTDSVIKTISIGREPEWAFKGAMMRHPYWSRDGKYVYASDDVNNRIVKIDASDFAIKAAISMPGPNHYLHPSKDGNMLYAVNETTGTGASVTIIDSESDKVVKDIPIPLQEGEKGGGHHGEFSRDGKFFYVCNEGGRTVALIDTTKLEVVKTLKAGMGAGHPAMTKDGRYILVIQHRDNVVTVIDTAKQEVVKKIAAGTGKKQAHASYFTPDGRYFYMINAEDNVLFKIDIRRMEAVSKIPVGNTAMFFGIKEGDEFINGE